MASESVGGELTDQDRLLLVFAYLGPLALVSLVATRREFVKWHAKQGLLLSIAVVGLYVILRAIHWPLAHARYLAFFAEIFGAGMVLAGLGVLVLLVLCVVRALEGERFKVPLIGDLADRL